MQGQQIATRLTEYLDITHPVLSAPMALVAGGELAAAVSGGGGLGLIGGGYGDDDWLNRAFVAAKNQVVGCGIITWSLAHQPDLLARILDHAPKAVFLSFGDPAAFIPQIKASGAEVICQIQTLKDAKAAVDLGADIIVAQGAEAGGHGSQRATMTLVPEVADYLAAHAPEVLLCAAGGIADGRGLAAALMLGADGVVIGSRFLASHEALLHTNVQAAILAADGDATVQTRVTDIARGKTWTRRYRIRILANAFSRKWQDREDELAADPKQQAIYAAGFAAGDTSIVTPVVGEGVGLIHTAQPAAEILDEIISEAAALLASAGQKVVR